jgi:hypothetical protein
MQRAVSEVLPFVPNRILKVGTLAPAAVFVAERRHLITEPAWIRLLTFRAEPVRYVSAAFALTSAVLALASITELEVLVMTKKPTFSMYSSVSPGVRVALCSEDKTLFEFRTTSTSQDSVASLFRHHAFFTERVLLALGAARQVADAVVLKAWPSTSPTLTAFPLACTYSIKWTELSIAALLPRLHASVVVVLLRYTE